MEPSVLVGVISGIAGSALLVAMRMLAVHFAQSSATDDEGGGGGGGSGGASCRMHCGSDGADFEVAAGASTSPPPPAVAEPPIERRQSSMDIVRDRARSFARQYNHIRVRHTSAD